MLKSVSTNLPTPSPSLHAGRGGSSSNKFLNFLLLSLGALRPSLFKGGVGVGRFAYKNRWAWNKFQNS